MIPLFWFFLALPLVLAIEWVLDRTVGRGGTLGPLAWQRSAGRIGALALAGVLTWWLLDVPGELRFISYLQAGQFDEAAANQPQPLVELSFKWLLTAAALCIILGGAVLIYRPQRQAALFVGLGMADRASIVAVRSLGGLFAVFGLLALVAAVFGA